MRFGSVRPWSTGLETSLNTSLTIKRCVAVVYISVCVCVCVCVLWERWHNSTILFRLKLWFSLSAKSRQRAWTSPKWICSFACSVLRPPVPMYVSFSLPHQISPIYLKANLMEKPPSSFPHILANFQSMALREKLPQSLFEPLLGLCRDDNAGE